MLQYMFSTAAAIDRIEHMLSKKPVLIGIATDAANDANVAEATQGTCRQGNSSTMADETRATKEGGSTSGADLVSSDFLNFIFIM